MHGIAAECLLISIGVAAEGPGTHISIHSLAHILMARVHFIVAVELNREQKGLNFILNIGLTLRLSPPDAGIPVSHHSLSWRQVAFLGCSPMGGSTGRFPERMEEYERREG